MKHQLRFQSKLLSLLLGLLLLGGHITTLNAAESAQTLLIVTPYPKFITQEYRQSFKKQYPKIELEIIKMGTSEAIDYFWDNRSENIVDIFWASSPESFSKLKSDGILQQYKANSRGIPKIISGVQISDSENAYTGYALSGYGFMWNTRYLKIKELPVPENWESLGQAKYYGHLGMSTPALSSTTHVAIESILQTRGWDEGWKLVKAIAGNTKNLSKRSFHVPKNVQEGEHGIGVTIDYYALSSIAQHNPVDFSYPSPAVLLPASVAMIKNAPNPEAAKLFIDFLVSPRGQSMLLDNKSRRIPILPATFEEAPEDYPNPYEDDKLSAAFDFDIELSAKRYQLIDVMFDAVISNNFDLYRQATAAVYQLEEVLRKHGNSGVKEQLNQAKEALMWMPDVTYKLSQKDRFLAAFSQIDVSDSEELSSKSDDYLKQWSSEAKSHYQTAIQLVEQTVKKQEK